VAKEAEPSCFNDTGNWRAAGSLSDGSVDNVSGMYGIRRIFPRDDVLKASNRRGQEPVIVHVSDPYTNTGRT